MWKIPKQGFNEPRQKSKLDRFFDNQTKAQALIRESIQNSLDAEVDQDKPVEIRFAFDRISQEKFKKYYRGYDRDLNEHLRACGKNPDHNPIKYLTIEDYNTEGLTGPIDHMEYDDNDNPVTGNFIGFWWSEGLSDKRKGSGGSHGVGKITLSTSSTLNTFLALTKRNDDKRELLLGYSQLKYHSFDRSQYKGYGRYGKLNNGRIWPYDDENLDKIDQFRNDFNIKRSDETGLSVVIPAIDEDINFESIIESILKDFYLPLMNNQLVITVSDLAKELTIDSKNLVETSQKYLNNRKDRELITSAQEMLDLLDSGMVYPKYDTGLGKVRKRGIKTSDFHEEDLEKMQKEFTAGQMVGVTIPVTIKHKSQNSNGNETEKSRFHLFIKNNEDTKLKRSTNYIRDKLLIKNEGTSMIKPYSVAFVYINDDGLSEFLKQAEDPGHEQWFYKTLRENGNFEEDTPLRLIKNAVSDFYNVLAGVEEDQTVHSILPNIFNVEEEDAGDTDGPIGPKPPPPIKSKSKSPFVLSRKSGGFEVKKSKDIDDLLESGLIAFPFRIQVKMGYEKTTGSGIKNYKPMDFDISKTEQFDIKSENGAVVRRDNNLLIVEITDKNYSITVTGFDKNRDLEIRCKLNEVQEV